MNVSGAEFAVFEGLSLAVGEVLLIVEGVCHCGADRVTRGVLLGCNKSITVGEYWNVRVEKKARLLDGKIKGQEEE